MDCIYSQGVMTQSEGHGKAHVAAAILQVYNILYPKELPALELTELSERVDAAWGAFGI